MNKQMDRIIEHIDEMIRLDEHTKEGMMYLDHFRRVAESYKQSDEHGLMDGLIIGLVGGVFLSLIGIVLFVKLYV